MNNSDYWKQRFEQLENAQNALGEKTRSEIEKLYDDTLEQLEAKIILWYQRLADNNGISMAEARRWLKGSELKEFKWTVDKYIKYGKENALNQKWVKELENASARHHISRLESLKILTRQNFETLFANQQNAVHKAFSDIYKSGYFHTAYEVQKFFNVGWDIAGLDQAQIEKVLSKPWAVDGYNFSERIWRNKDRLISEVHRDLSQNVLLGADPQKAIDSLAKKMNTSKYNAGRLVMTEEAYFSSAAQKDCFGDLGVEQYEIVATLDSHTSKICRRLDGKVFPMSDYQAGVTAPPFHVYCRSTTAPYFDDEFYVGERAARDKDGKTYYVPADMKYSEWEKTFADGGSKEGLETVDKSGGSGIIKMGEVKDMSINAIELPIEQKHTGKGNPNAIITFGVDLNNRQKVLLNLLPEFDSRVAVPKKSVNMADLSALTAQTGHEFAMFTKGNERLIIRGNACSVNISVDDAKELSKNGYRWSGHTHPGTDFNCLIASSGDKAVLQCFSHKSSVIYNSKGNYATFEKEE